MQIEGPQPPVSNMLTFRIQLIYTRCSGPLSQSSGVTLIVELVSPANLPRFYPESSHPAPTGSVQKVPPGAVSPSRGDACPTDVGGRVEQAQG